MDARERAIQQEAAEALLDAGVSVPLKRIRVPFRKEPWTLRLTMHRPRLSTQIRIARLYLGLGVTADELAGFTKDEEIRFIAEHGRDVSRMVALSVLSTTGRCRLLGGVLAWVIRHWMEPRYMKAALTHFVLLLGTQGFTTIIRSVEAANPLRPRLSQEREGS